MAPMTACRQCGEMSPADGQFCIGCGASLAPASTGPTVKLNGPRCPHCQTPNPANARFCVACGGGLVAQAPRRPTPVRPAPRVYPRMYAPPMVHRMPPRPASARHSNHGGMAKGVFILGIIFLLLTHRFWPGILVVGALSTVVGAIENGHNTRALMIGFWLIGLAVLISSKVFFPGILVLLFVSWMFGMIGRGRGHW